MSQREYHPRVEYDIVYLDGREIKIKSTPSYEVACFSALGFSQSLTDAKEIIFHCKIAPNLDLEAIKFYVDFLRKILNKDFVCFDVKYSKKNKQLKFFLQIEPFNYLSKDALGNSKRAKILLYLTAFRYIQEFPEIVSLFFKSAAQVSELEKQFEIFQTIHNDYEQMCQDEKYYSNLYGHGLISYGPYSSSSPIPISLENFHKKLNSNGCCSVQHHFT